MDDTTRGIGDPAPAGTLQAQPARGTSSARGRSSTKSNPMAENDTSLDRDLDRDTDARTRELQAEIAETREDLSETVDAIQEKLRPSNIVSEGTEAVKTAATRRVRDMAETATDTAYEIVERTR